MRGMSPWSTDTLFVEAQAQEKKFILTFELLGFIYQRFYIRPIKIGSRSPFSMSPNTRILFKVTASQQHHSLHGP